MRADIVVERLGFTQKFKQHPMAVINGIRPQPFELSLERMGLQAAIEWIGAEDLIPVTGQVLDGNRQLAERSFEVRSERDTVKPA